MLDRSIPYYNLILRCARPPELPPVPRDGWVLRMYEPGDETGWARLEHGIGDFESAETAERYFLETYAFPDAAALRERCVVAEDRAGRVVGACIAWSNERAGASVGALHWLVVSPACEGRGIGTALCLRCMEILRAKGAYPVYIHTQPWSHRAVRLYVRLGFRLQRTDTFAGYENQFEPAMHTLEKLLPEAQMRALRAHTDA